jgi:hypothetical protein
MTNSQENRRAKAFRALIDRVSGPNAAGVHRADIEHAITALQMQMFIAREKNTLRYPRKIQRMLDDVSYALAGFGIAATEDSKRREKLMDAGMKRLGFAR